MAKTFGLRDQHGFYRLIIALVIPLLAAAIQWILWSAFQPYVWFLFYPAVFFSSWVDGLRGGLAATALSAALAWFLFIPPQFTFTVQSPMTLAWIGMFVAM